jgi:hypothetical protein
MIFSNKFGKSLFLNKLLVDISYWNNEKLYIIVSLNDTKLVYEIYLPFSLMPYILYDY